MSECTACPQRLFNAPAYVPQCSRTRDRETWSIMAIVRFLMIEIGFGTGRTGNAFWKKKNEFDVGILFLSFLESIVSCHDEELVFHEGQNELSGD